MRFFAVFYVCNFHNRSFLHSHYPVIFPISYGSTVLVFMEKLAAFSISTEKHIPSIADMNGSRPKPRT